MAKDTILNSTHLRPDCSYAWGISHAWRSYFTNSKIYNFTITIFNWKRGELHTIVQLIVVLSNETLQKEVKYIFSYVILCENRLETSQRRQIQSFVTFVNTYSGNYGNRKNVPLVKNKTKIYGKIVGASAILGIIPYGKKLLSW